MDTQNLNESLQNAILQIYNEFHPTTGIPLNINVNASIPNTDLKGEALFNLSFFIEGQYNFLNFEFRYINYGYTILILEKPNDNESTDNESNDNEPEEPTYAYIWEPGIISEIKEITPNTHGNYFNKDELKKHCLLMNKVSGFIYNKFEIIIGTIETILQNYLPESSS